MGKSDKSSGTRALDLHVHASGAALGEGEALKVKGGGRARLQVGDAGLRIDAALPAASLAEQRWVLDKALRKVRGLFKVGKVTLYGAAEVDDDALATLALDAHQAHKGKVEVAGRPAVQALVQRVGAAEDLYRRWVNEDPTIRTSVAIADDIAAWAAEREDVEVEVFDEARCQAEGLNLLMAVGGASQISPPRLVMARYRGAAGGASRGDATPLMLVGKGVTFDSGGINVKPYASYVSMMKNDMAGAALAWTLFKTLVEGGREAPLALAIPTCENPIGEGAMRPGALVKGHRGKTVRIDHTDAEGRLILADALSYASEKYDPAQIMVFATLTTSALVSYGPYTTPVHFAEGAMKDALASASAATGEDLHFFPARIWHREANRDREADVKNTARLPSHAARAAGSRNAAHFLTFFTDAPLVHLDIFASTWNWAGDAPGAGYGATGAPLRTVLRALEALG